MVDALGGEAVLALPAREFSQGRAEVQDVLFRDAPDIDLAEAWDQMLVEGALHCRPVGSPPLDLVLRVPVVRELAKRKHRIQRRRGANCSRYWRTYRAG